MKFRDVLFHRTVLLLIYRLIIRVMMMIIIFTFFYSDYQYLTLKVTAHTDKHTERAENHHETITNYKKQILK
jgi:hypothetical protein